MHKQNANIDFTGFTETEIVPAARQIQNEMTTNIILYPTPPVAIVLTLKGQIDAYEVILGKPIYDTKTADLHASRKTLNTSLHDNGLYVNGIAKGDLVKLGQSGYPISQLISPVGDLPAPASIKVSNGGSLSFKLDIATVDHAVGYLIALTPVTNTETDPNLWRIVWSSRHSRTIGGNTHGTEYKFAACAVGTTDNLSWLTSGTTLFAQ